MFTAAYNEGASVGYKWFFERGHQPLFPFGFGLSYTSFALSQLVVTARGRTVTASATVRNTGERPGTAIPQFYVSGPDKLAHFRCASSDGIGSTSSQGKSGLQRCRSTRGCWPSSTRMRESGVFNPAPTGSPRGSTPNSET